MTGTEKDRPQDNIGVDDVSSLYRRAEDAQPPSALDDAVLGAARKAADETAAQTRRISGPFAGHWPAIASAAAVFVIAIMVAPSIEQEAPPPERAALQPGHEEMRKSAAGADRSVAQKAERARAPATSPMRAEPAPFAVQSQSRPAMESSDVDEDAVSAPGHSGVTDTGYEAVAGSPENSSAERSKARLGAAGGAPFAVFTPEMWLVKIQHLVDSGRIAAARAELDRFRQAHPDHEIDEHLLETLKQP